MELDMYNMVVQADGSVTYQLTDPTTWGAWAHEGHRLWASMSEDFWLYEYKVVSTPQLFDDLTLQATPNRLRMLSLYSAITGDDVFSSPVATASAVATAATTMSTLRAPLPANEEDTKSVHYADDEDSLLNDYPHRDLIMDFMR
ncbi:hypothetical protein TRIUR3_29563 [Triticum urartu]|uniref:Uncharacterized protein n=2 Tax=Triticum TaxID=4564 RepID=A0A9R1NKQ6_TRITD|nr:hypothetical protein TRIUR3_29563 [Triticum urartu]VAH26742.1 unnamed protein product [Triticum turgidum subsp. durum]